MTTRHVITSALSYPVALQLDVPPPADIASESVYPFTLYLSADNIGPHTIYLYAQDSNSAPWQTPRNKWSHLLPQWRFTDTSENRNTINAISPTTTNVFTDISGNVIGMTASAEFFYVDDMSVQGCNPIIIWATLEVSGNAVEADGTNCGERVPGYANSKVVVAAPYYINSLAPTRLEIRRDGINPLFDIYWLRSHIPHVITLHGDFPAVDWCPDASVGDGILFNLPESNAQAIIDGTVYRTITTLPTSDQTWDPNNNSSYLSAIDENFYRVGGFLRSDVVPLSSSNNTTITAGVSVTYTPTYRHTAFAWVANPDNGTLNRLYAPCVPTTTIHQITSFMEKEKFKYAAGGMDYFSTPIVTSVFGLSLSGFSGTYGIAVDPCYNVWVTDVELDAIHKYDVQGNRVSSLYLRQIPAVTALDSSILSAGVGPSPAGISLDGLGNIWVTLFDAPSVLKFDAISGTLIAVAAFQNFYPADPLYPTNPPFSDLGFKPVLAEPDQNNDIWVSTTNTLCSMILKFDNDGVQYGGDTINLPPCANPMDILVDFDNNIWVSLTEHAGPPYLSGGVWKYDTSVSPPVRISAVEAINPEYLAMDINGTLWYTSDFNTVNYITTAFAIGSFTVGATAQPAWVDPAKLEFNALEGIASDPYGRIFVINSLENNVYIYESDGTNIGIAKVNPDNNYVWYNDTGSITFSSSRWAKSAEAFGDWTGFRWQIKYADASIYDTITVYITGESNEFDIRDFRGLGIRKFNESFNVAEQVHSYAISPHINDNTVLFNGFLSAVWGGQEEPSFGRESYEAVANFVQNNFDIEECEIPQLYSHAQKLDVPIDDYNLSYPAILKRIMDIVSINQQILWGTRCTCQLNITNEFELVLSGDEYKPIPRYCPRCGHEHAGNRGDGFDPATYVVSAYIPFVIKDRYEGGTYSLITPAPSCDSPNRTTQTCVTSYPLTANWENVIPDYFIDITGTFDEEMQRLCFFDYVKWPCGKQIEGVINWDDEYTTISEQESGINDWLGSGETVEKIINYTLHRGLGLIED